MYTLLNLLNQNEDQLNHNHATNSATPHIGSADSNFNNFSGNNSSFIKKDIDIKTPLVRKRRISSQPDVPYSNLSNNIQHNESPKAKLNNNIYKPGSMNNNFDSLYKMESKDDQIFSIYNLLNNHSEDQAKAEIKNEYNCSNSFIPFPHDEHISNSYPTFKINVKPVSMMSFDELCNDPNIKINPKHIGLIPSFYWKNKAMKFGTLVTTFFRKRNMASSKFPQKLYNALKISECYPDFAKHIGIQWATNDVFRVDGAAFARLLGIKSIEGSLFHQQGNFPSHGFVELDFQESEKLSLENGFGHVDLSQVRFLRSSHGNFNRYTEESDLSNFKWSSRPS